MISYGAMLAPFDIKELRDLMEYDDLEFDKLEEQKNFLNILCYNIHKIILNSTQNGICVVPFDGQQPYNELIKYKGGCKAMNTDKIYAESLANEYAPKDTAKVVALKKLDRRAKLPATIFTYTFGIIAALVAGVGMCLSMAVIGAGGTVMTALGIAIGIIGFAGMGINYPVYRKMPEKGKQKYAFEIVELAKEICEN